MTCRTAWRRRRRGDDGDRGFSYPEVVVSVVLLGLVATAVLGATAAATRGSADHRRIANAQTWLASAADRITTPGLGLPACGAAGATYTDAVAGAEQPAGFGSATLHVVAVESAGIDGVFGVCQAGDPLHRITLEVSAADGRLLRSLQIVKSAGPSAIPPPPPVTPTSPPPNTVSPPATTAPRKCTLDLNVGASVATPQRVASGVPLSPLLNGFDLTLSVNAHIGLGLLSTPLLAVTVCAGAQVAYNTGLTQVTRAFPAFSGGFRCRVDLGVVPGLNGVFDGLCSALQGVLNPVLALISLLGIQLDIFLSASATLSIPATPDELWTSGEHSLLVLDSTLNQLQLLQVTVL